MPQKKFVRAKNLFKVTFSLPTESGAQTASLCGDFNEWSKTSHPMKKQKDGRFKLTLELAAGRHYHFRYFLDDQRWENDWDADAYVPNSFGDEDSVIYLDAPSE